jgi:hypothetical protein
MKRINAREKILGIAAGAAVFLQLTYMLVVSPVSRRFAETDTRIKQVKGAIMRYRELERQRPALMAGYQQVERYLQLKGTENERLTTVLTKIESEAKNAGITIIDLKPVLTQAKSSKTAASSCRAHLSGEGKIEDVGKLLYGLGRSEIYFVIENFSLSLKDENKGTMKIEVDILGTAFS